MFRLALKNCTQFTNQIVRQYCKTDGALKVSVCGAAGISGQALALLLKMCPLIDELALYDVCSSKIIAMELNYIDTKCKVLSYKRDIKEALRNSHIVVLIASAPNGSDFLQNADIVCDLATDIAEHCPKVFRHFFDALIAVATNPVNSMVPLVSEVMKQYGVYNRRHVFGITTLDVMRTNSIVAQKLGVMPEKVHVPCIGGHGTTCTIVPILSGIKPELEFTEEEKLSITEAVQYSQSRIKEGVCTGYLSGALATAQFVISLVRALKGEQNIVETCLIQSKSYPNMPYLATAVLLGTDGFTKDLGVPSMTDYENYLFKTCRAGLSEEVQRGEDYIKSKFSQICS